MAALTPPTIVAATGRRLAEFAAGLNVALAPLAQSVGIAVEDLDRTDHRISLEAFMRLLQLIEVVSGEDCVGLHYARYFHPGDSGAFGFALLHAPSLREALRIYHNYLPVAADVGFLEITEDGPDVTVRWRYSRLVDNPRQYTDFHAGLVVRMLRRFLGEDWTPRRVELTRSRPRSTALHRTLFGPSIGFQAAATNSVVLPRDRLDATSETADPRLFALMEETCRDSLAARERGRDLRLQVSGQIQLLLPQGNASVPQVAAALAMGGRSLQRRLSELGTSFESLVEETRRDVSDRLLPGATPLAEISYLCGYSNASAYSRAARGWYGMSPQAMRQRLRGTGRSDAT